MSIVGDRLLPWFERALDLSAKRHELLAGNIANVDTPHYVPKDLEFRNTLGQELDQSVAGTSTAGLAATNRPDNHGRLDGNQVDLDLELTRFASNRTFHELATEVVSRRMALMRYAIDEAGRR